MTIFASTPPKNDDPKPWRYKNNPDIRREDGDLPVAEVHYIYAPRPEFDQPREHSENPVLVEFRDEARRLGAAYPSDWLRLTEPGYLPADMEAERDHARRVLSRLAVFA